MTLLVTKQSLFNLYNTYLPKISTRLFYFLIAQLLHTKKAADFVICCLFLIFPAYDSYKQNTISSVSERLFSFSLLYLIRKAEHDFYATLALRSPKGVVRPGRWNFKQNRISSVFERLLGRPLGRIANGVRRHYLSY